MCIFNLSTTEIVLDLSSCCLQEQPYSWRGLCQGWDWPKHFYYRNAGNDAVVQRLGRTEVSPPYLTSFLPSAI